MSYFPNCREDEIYNENNLTEADKRFVAGFDYAVQVAMSLFEGNAEVYPELERLLDDKCAVIMEGKAELVADSLRDWAEMERNVLITALIDERASE